MKKLTTLAVALPLAVAFLLPGISSAQSVGAQQTEINALMSQLQLLQQELANTQNTSQGQGQVLGASISASPSGDIPADISISPSVGPAYGGIPLTITAYGGYFSTSTYYIVDFSQTVNGQTQITNAGFLQSADGRTLNFTQPRLIPGGYPPTQVYVLDPTGQSNSVSFEVTYPTANVTYMPSSLSFTAQTASTSNLFQYLTTASDQPIQAMAVSSAPWLDVGGYQPSTLFYVPQNGTSTIAVAAVNYSSMAPGVYTGAITISMQSSSNPYYDASFPTHVVPVTLTVVSGPKPEISNVTPSSAPVGTLVKITGSGFTTNSYNAIVVSQRAANGSPAKILGVSYHISTDGKTLYFTVPEGPFPGLADVYIVNANGQGPIYGINL
jgi:hypothetical protein